MNEILETVESMKKNFTDKDYQIEVLKAISADCPNKLTFVLQLENILHFGYHEFKLALGMVKFTGRMNFDKLLIQLLLNKLQWQK